MRPHTTLSAEKDIVQDGNCHVIIFFPLWTVSIRNPSENPNLKYSPLSQLQFPILPVDGTNAPSFIVNPWSAGKEAKYTGGRQQAALSPGWWSAKPGNENKEGRC